MLVCRVCPTLWSSCSRLTSTRLCRMWSHAHTFTQLLLFFFPNAAFVQSFIFYIKGWQDGTGSTTVVCFLETGRRPRSHSPLPTVILEPTGSWWCKLLKYSFNLLVLLLQTSEAATKHLADESQWFLRQNDQRKQQKKVVSVCKEWDTLPLKHTGCS